MVDWYSVLTKYGVDVPYAEQVMISCPFHDDRRVSCSLNLDLGLWICFAGCGQGSLKGFIFKLSGKSWEELSYELDDNLDIQSTELDSVFLEQELEDGYREVGYEEPENLMEVPNNHWIYDRGFTKQLVLEWDCKVNQYLDFMIPAKNADNEVLGWISRRLQAIPKYLFSRGFKKSQTLFGINHIKEEQELYIVEGALDCMWLQQHGYASVGVLGANLSKKQKIFFNPRFKQSIIDFKLNQEKKEISIIGTSRTAGFEQEMFLNKSVYNYSMITWSLEDVFSLIKKIKLNFNALQISL